jgi:hypothetical protein
MPLSLDGMAVLGKIAANSRVFAEVKPDAAKQGRALVVKQLKAKAGDRESLRAVKRALGPRIFDAILDGLSDADIRSLLHKLDRYCPDMKGSNAGWRREHLRDLATGKARPTPAPAPTQAKRPAKRRARKMLGLESMQVRPKRRRR